MEHKAFQAWLAEADGLSALQREEAARVLAEPASSASVLALLEARLEGTRRCPHCTTEGAVIPTVSIVGARTGSGAMVARVAAGLSMPRPARPP